MVAHSHTNQQILFRWVAMVNIERVDNVHSQVERGRCLMIVYREVQSSNSEVSV